MRESPFPVEGILSVNKEAGPSSNGVLQQVRRILGGIKAGHAGTLDPMAEGVLLLCLGEGTKLVPFLAGFEKEYEGTIIFGEERDSYDSTGRVTASMPTDHLTEDRIRREMAAFLGAGRQVPPMFSAVKQGGVPLYRLARRGKTVPRKEREIVIREFSLLSWEPPGGRFRVACGGGTYIRTLCHDLGLKCGSAAYMSALKRTAVGPFRLGQSLTMRQIEESAAAGTLPVVSPAAALSHLREVLLDAEGAMRVRQGRPPLMEYESGPAPPAAGELVKLVGPDGRLVAVVRDQGPGAAVSIERVFT